ASGVNRFSIANSGTLTATAYTTNGGLLYTNGSGVVAQTGAGTGTQCLLGGTTPTWGSCSTGSSTSPFTEVTSNGTIVQNNITEDLLLGGTSTASAKFAVLNMTGSGTPVASVSSGTSGNGISLAANGVIQTTRNTNLTLGGNTTGSILLMPNNGSGRVGIGTT